MIKGLFGQVKDEKKPRRKRNIVKEIDDLLRKKDYSFYELKKELNMSYEKLGLILKIMEQQGELIFISKTQKYKKLWGKP